MSDHVLIFVDLKLQMNFIPLIDIRVVDSEPEESLYSYNLRILKVPADFRGESICRLSWKVFASTTITSAMILYAFSAGMISSTHMDFWTLCLNQ